MEALPTAKGGSREAGLQASPSKQSVRLAASSAAQSSATPATAVRCRGLTALTIESVASATARDKIGLMWSGPSRIISGRKQRESAASPTDVCFWYRLAAAALHPARAAAPGNFPSARRPAARSPTARPPPRRRRGGGGGGDSGEVPGLDDDPPAELLSL